MTLPISENDGSLVNKVRKDADGSVRSLILGAITKTCYSSTKR